METTYGGVEIRYEEKTNCWRFELRGRERHAESLAKAKEAINKPEPKAKTFKRTNAYYRTYAGKFETVDVTSLASDRSFDGDGYAWIVRAGDRRKEPLARLFSICEENDALVKQIVALDAETEQLSQRREKLCKVMQRLVVKESV